MLKFFGRPLSATEYKKIDTNLFNDNKDVKFYYFCHNNGK